MSPHLKLVQGKSPPASFLGNCVSQSLSLTIQGGQDSIDSVELATTEIFTRIDPKTNQRVLTFYGLMLAGAIARAIVATAVHPLNVIKTMLQTEGGRIPELTWPALSRGMRGWLLYPV